MSPTEFSNYIKQRAILQQQASTQQSPVGLSPMAANNSLFSATSTSTVSPHNSRSLSPNSTQMDSANGFMLMATGNGANSPTSPNGTYGSGPQSPYTSSASSTPSNRAAFISGLFDNNYLSELVGSGELSKANAGQHQQNKANGMNRFTSFLDKASPFISSPNNPSLTGVGASVGNSFSGTNLNFGGLSSDSTLNGSSGTASNSSKAFDNINYNLNGVSYPNQYQHLLVAN